MRTAWFWVVVGAVGWGAMAWLQPEVDPYARVGYSLTRAEAVRVARETAARFGVQAGDWKAAVAADTANSDLRVTELVRDRGSLRFVAGVRTSVRLWAPNGEDHFTVTLSPQGRVLAFSRKAPPQSGPDDADAPSQGDRDAAVDALRLLTGDDFPAFSPLGGPGRSDGGMEMVWEAPGPTRLIDSLKATVRVHKGVVVRASVRPNYTAAFSETVSEPGGDVILIFVAVVLVLAAALAGLAFYLMGTIDRLLPPRKVLWVVPVFLALWLVHLLGQAAIDQGLIQDDSWFEIALQQAAFLILVAAPVMLAVWGGGLVIAGRVSMAPALTLDLLGEGKLLHRPVGASLAAGLWCSGALAAIPFGLVASGLFADARLQRWSPLAWAGATPALPGTVWLEGPFVWLAIYFAVLRPFWRIYFSNRWILLGLRFVGGTLLLLLWPVRDSVAGVLLAGAAIWAFTELVHRRFGVLAVMAMGLGAGAAVTAGSMLLQPSPGLFEAGVVTFALLGLGVALFLGVALRGRPLDLADETRKRDRAARERFHQRRAERDRLMAEFAVARRAQQLMLPAAPPAFPGVEIAGVCRPAREVGGDLFDFLAMKNGDLGVVVADVAGKGVPAALYMTLTKGLLASVCENQWSPEEIAAEVNDHFHFSGGRSVFLTMALGVFQPGSGRVRCVRAGHNPLVWRRAAKRETISVKPSGIGLGLAPSRLLRRSLSVQEVDLEPGDALFFYSDGVTEAMNSRSEEYGEERLNAVIAACDTMSAEQTRDQILSDVDRFVGNTPANDDITLVVVRRLEVAASQ